MEASGLTVILFYSIIWTKNLFKMRFGFLFNLIIIDSKRKGSRVIE